VGKAHGTAAGGQLRSTTSRGTPIEGSTPGRYGWARHLEGWQPGLIAVFIAGTAAVLAVPRSVEPAEIPMPLPNARALSLVAAADEARAQAAEELGLDADVRELGSGIRAFGHVDENPLRTDAELLAARKRVLDAVGPALAQGDEAVLRLRAYQLRSFLREVRRWRATGEESDELRELGGDFLGLLRRSGWLGDRRRPSTAPLVHEDRQLTMDDAVLCVLFKKRWSAIAGIERSPFDVTLDEERALFGFLLSHPLGAAPSGALEAPIQRGEASEARSTAAARIAAAQKRHAEDQYRLKKIEELALRDPTYPKELARGILLYRLGKYLPAVEAFRRHLDMFPDAAHVLRARNYLHAALSRAEE
jgi:hypothetical protein